MWCWCREEAQGEKDYTADIMDELSTEGFYPRNSHKAGKPTILAFDRESETILGGLPGHPAAALLIFELFIGWLYRELTFQKEPEKIKAEISENVPSAGGKATCIFVELVRREGRSCEARPILGKSGLITLLTKADGYTVTDANSEGVNEGDTVEVTLF